MQLQAPQRCHKPPDATNLEATPEKGAQFLGHLGCLGIWAALKMMPTRRSLFHFFHLGIIFRAAQMPRQPRQPRCTLARWHPASTPGSDPHLGIWASGHLGQCGESPLTGPSGHLPPHLGVWAIWASGLLISETHPNLASGHLGIWASGLCLGVVTIRATSRRHGHLGAAASIWARPLEARRAQGHLGGHPGRMHLGSDT